MTVHDTASSRPSREVDKWKEISTLSLSLVDIESFKSGSDIYFTSVWREGSDGHYLWHARSWRVFTDKWEELAVKNLRLTVIETYTGLIFGDSIPIRSSPVSCPAFAEPTSQKKVRC